MFAACGRDRINRGWDRMRSLVTALERRAQRDATCAPTCGPPTCLLIEFMISAAARYAEPVKLEIWRRYLALILEALGPQRAGTTPLPEPALRPHAMLAVMRAIGQRP